MRNDKGNNKAKVTELPARQERLANETRQGGMRQSKGVNNGGSLSNRGTEVCHLSVVERRTWSGIPRQQAFLRKGRKFKFNLHGEVERPGFSNHHLP